MKERFRIYFVQGRVLTYVVVIDTIENVLTKYDYIYLTDYRGRVIMDKRKIGKLFW